MTDDAEVLRAAHQWRVDGRGVALATVVETWGSAPRGAGSHLAIRDDRLFVGSVSGGCVEGAVVEAALALMGSGRGRAADLRRDQRPGVGRGAGLRRHHPGLGGGCGVRTRTLRALADATARREPVVLAIPLAPSADGAESRLVPLDDPELGEAARAALASGQPQQVGAVFLRPYPPPLRLLIIGAVHIAQALAPMAQLVGYEVIVIDPRRAFARPERWPGARVIGEYPDDAFVELGGLDARCAVVALTHDPKIDDPGLLAALDSPAFYIGALGSRRTHARRRERLGAAGHGEAALDRIRGPVGLSIGARTPAEIAVAVLAEVTATLRGAR